MTAESRQSPAMEQVLRQLECPHQRREGGNDYILCPDCNLYWDYRRETPNVAIAVKLRALLAEDRLRQGCECKCCDHAEGSDCGCQCHSTGKCAAEDRAPQPTAEPPTYKSAAWSLQARAEFTLLEKLPQFNSAEISDELRFKCESARASISDPLKHDRAVVESVVYGNIKWVRFEDVRAALRAAKENKE